MKREHGDRKKKGMTLLEVIIGLVLIGILSAVAFGRFHYVNAELIGQRTTMKTYLRYAQLRAINTSIIWGIKFEQGVYWLFNHANTDTPVFLPGAETAKLDLKAQYGISIELMTASPADTFLIAFDSLGRPGTEIANAAVVPSTEDLNLSIMDDSNMEPQRLTIAAQTGYIP